MQSLHIAQRLKQRPQIVSRLIFLRLSAQHETIARRLCINTHTLSQPLERRSFVMKCAEKLSYTLPNCRLLSSSTF